MKKVLSLAAAAAMLAVVACGPSAEEKQKANEKRIQDSIEAAQRYQDSVDAYETSLLPADTTVVADTNVATEAPAQ